MTKMILGQTICQLAITLVLYFGWFSLPGHQESSDINDAKMRRNSVVFNTFVWLQLFNALSSRRTDNQFNVLEGITRNWLFFMISFLLVGGQVLVMFIGGVAFKAIPLNGTDWSVSIALGALSIPCGVIIRLIPDWAVHVIFSFVQRLSDPSRVQLFGLVRPRRHDRFMIDMDIYE
jgi:Ca2+-transporting ATPase